MAKPDKAKEVEEVVEAPKEVEAVASAVRPKLSDLVKAAREGHEKNKADALKAKK